MTKSKTERENGAAITQKMKELYDIGLSLEEVGREFGMTRAGVRHRFIQAGIARRDPKHKIDKDRLVELYSVKKLPVLSIAGEFGVGQNKVKAALKAYSIPRRSPINKGGYIVDFLRSLNVNEQRAIKGRGKKYLHLHHTAKRLGIKIMIRKRGSGEFDVTRLE